MHDSPMVESGWHEGGGGGSVASIQGPREQFVRVGSTITFTCVVSRTTRAGEASAVTHRATPASRAQLKWTHAGRDVTFQVRPVITFHSTGEKGKASPVCLQVD